MHNLELPLKATWKLQVLPRWLAGHLPKLTNHMDFISPSPLILPDNLLAYESISQFRKPKGVKCLFSLRLPTLSDSTKIINRTPRSLWEFWNSLFPRGTHLRISLLFLSDKVKSPNSLPVRGMGPICSIRLSLCSPDKPEQVNYLQLSFITIQKSKNLIIGSSKISTY